LLDLHHDNLCILFPGFASACSRDRFIDTIAAVIDRWSRNSAAADCEGGPPSADCTPEEESSPSADFTPEDAAGYDVLLHLTAASAAAAAGHDHDDPASWAGRSRPSVHAEFAGLFPGPAGGRGSCARDSGRGFADIAEHGLFGGA
jgi:hypothetical protein